MKIKPLLVAAAVCASFSSQAGVLLSEGFNNVNALTSTGGWTVVANGTGTGAGWFQGNAGIFPAASGAANSYAAANAPDAPLGSAISDWLLTPVLSIFDGARLSFDLRLLGDGFLDTVEVWASGAGASADTSLFSKVATFASDVDTGWVTQSLTLNGINANGRIAFRYAVGDTFVAGNYVGIDNVSVIPEPGTTALVGVALAGMLLLRRRRA